MSKSVISQVLAVEPIELELSVKCYPKSVDDLLQDITVKLFYNHAKGWLQIELENFDDRSQPNKDIVLSGALEIPEPLMLKLASLQAIATYGPFISLG